MKVLRICYEYPPHWGGLTAGPFEISRAQAALGCHVRFLAGGWPNRPIEPAHGITTHRLPTALPKLNLFASTAVAALPATLRWQQWADVIHGHQHLPVYYHLWRQRFGGSTPYVLHLHVTAAGRAAKADPQTLDSWTRRWEWPLHELSDRVGCQVADKIICTSAAVRDEAIRHYDADPNKIAVISNGVNTSHFSPDGEHQRRALGFSAEDVVILFVGVLNQRKRPHLLLNSLAHLPANWKILFVGRGPLSDSVQQAAVERGWEERVRMTGFVPYPQLPTLYRTANLFALTASYEGFPKVVMEALASSLPVMTTRSFAVDEALRPFVTVTDDESPAGIAAALQASMAQTVDLEIIHSQYDWKQKAKSIAAIYRQIGVSVDR